MRWRWVDNNLWKSLFYRVKLLDHISRMVSKLLEDLFRHVTESKFCFRYCISNGRLLSWDNKLTYKSSIWLEEVGSSDLNISLEPWLASLHHLFGWCRGIENGKSHIDFSSPPPVNNCFLTQTIAQRSHMVLLKCKRSEKVEVFLYAKRDKTSKYWWAVVISVAIAPVWGPWGAWVWVVQYCTQKVSKLTR